MINKFGIYGNSVDKMTGYTHSDGLSIHCTISSDPSITSTDWYFSNGTKVGVVYPHFREEHYNNGTTALHIGIDRSLSYCDGGNYTCVVNTTSGRTENRTFYLLIGCKLWLTLTSKLNCSYTKIQSISNFAH